MVLFVMALFAAVVSGRLAWRFDENRSLYLAICVTGAVTALVSGFRMIPESVWMAYTPHVVGVLIVLSVWTLRTNVRKYLLK